MSGREKQNVAHLIEELLMNHIEGNATETLKAQRPRINREARQQQILDAAIACVLLHGFHGASMSEIAKQARMSVGVIYRHFENKEAIIEAIVALDIAQLRTDVAESLLRAETGEHEFSLEHAIAFISRQHERKRSALALEIYAEAARNPKVEAIVRRSAAIERELILTLVKFSASPGLSPVELDARADMLRIIADGMTVRGLYATDTDHTALARGLSPYSI
jgi:TetR/AcrR family transcriptional regulator, repressor for uid operon